MGIRPVYGWMTQNTLRKLRRLVVKRRHRYGYGGRKNRRVALETDLIDLGTGQQVRISRAVRIVTRSASLFLNGCMLENKRPSRIDMTFRTD